MLHKSIYGFFTAPFERDDLEIHQGEVVCVISVSGSGKSTLLRSKTHLGRSPAHTLYP